MLMDTDMIYYVLEGHELQNDVQTMIQVFLANRHYTRTEEVTDAEITVKSEFKKGIASAMPFSYALFGKIYPQIKIGALKLQKRTV